MRAVHLLCIIIAMANAAPADNFLTHTFFDNYDTVWPENPNKLAYMFFAAVIDNTISNKILYVVDQRYILDPLIPPNADLKNSLSSWIQTTRFDPSVRYYRILKELEESTFDCSIEEFFIHRFSKAPDVLRTKELRHYKHEKRLRNPRRCETNYGCLEYRGDCLCVKTLSGKYCHSVQRGWCGA